MFWKIEYFIKDFVKDKEIKTVLDVGAQDINGSVKDALPKVERYVGVDMLAGKGVEVVLNGHELVKFFKESEQSAYPKEYDLVTCCETLEHDNKFWLTVENMKQMVKPGGYLLITVPSINFFKHDFPHDYYRFTEEAVKEMFEGFEDIYTEYYFDKADPNQEKPNNSVLAYGRKPL